MTLLMKERRAAEDKRVERRMDSPKPMYST